MAFTGLSFVEFKRRFYEKAGDLRLFDCMEFNLVKVVLDGLKVDYAGQGNTGTRFFQPGFRYAAGLLLKRLLKPARLKPGQEQVLQAIGERPWLLLDHSGRWSQDEKGQSVSLYFSEILASLGPEKVAHIVERQPQQAYLYDLCTAGLLPVFRQRPLDRDDQLLRKALVKTYRAIVSSGRFDEGDLQNIAIAIEKFFHEYRLWKYLLTFLKQDEIFLLCHYHREGSILAMRRAGRKITELQHGLIAPEDVFYCFPEAIRTVRDKALFPDRIFVYGPFWKERLLRGFEFSAAQVELAGYFMHDHPAVSAEREKQVEEWRQGKAVVLVTTQTHMHAVFIDYVRWLAGNNENQLILVRPHPAEKTELYAELETLPGTKVVRDNLGYLLKLCHWHVSVYSTTIFDALRYGKSSYSIDVKEYDDYIRSMEEAGVTRRISNRTNPANLAAAGGEVTDVARYYLPFDYRFFTRNNTK